MRQITNYQWFELDRTQLNSALQTQGLKHYWVAEAIGVHKSTLRRWLTGEIRCVQLAHVMRLASLLNVSRSELARESCRRRIGHP